MGLDSNNLFRLLQAVLNILNTLYKMLYTNTVDSVYFEITIIICFAALMSIVFRYLRQPAILAYMLTGILLGPIGLFHLQHNITLSSLGELGVTFLLFMLGLELKLRELKSIGLPVLIIGSLQMWFTFVIGFFIAFFLGYDSITA
jgi:Kef-type K+ transport system membrane component KefB